MAQNCDERTFGSERKAGGGSLERSTVIRSRQHHSQIYALLFDIIFSVNRATPHVSERLDYEFYLDGKIVLVDRYSMRIQKIGCEAFRPSASTSIEKYTPRIEFPLPLSSEALLHSLLHLLNTIGSRERRQGKTEMNASSVPLP